ncbi:hypothetical protein [Streptomyces sp. H39-S7]|uniref:hypothetical protein n=1 Tax=Streptomyces sp. H39-S7 TaxID=3004357 RepID=UPI0022AEE647|nr:hypothetical protein [Streptomyces sp. H39-S7]MCZ4119714.1 hypothetical protein [Streptomyces sp. H39-S7]
MSYSFMRLTGSDSSRLSEAEAEGLRSLHNACADVDEARGQALSTALHLSDSSDAIEEYVDSTGFLHHPRALSELGDATLEYERQVEAIGWRYSSAYAVLGITVLDRLVREQPPLGEDAVHLLCQEPTVGRLRAILSIPSSRLVAPSDGETEDDLPIGSYALKGLEEVRAAILSDGDDPMDEDQLDAGCLSAVRPLGVSPLGSLSFILTVATSVSWEICKRVDAV